MPIKNCISWTCRRGGFPVCLLPLDLVYCPAWVVISKIPIVNNRQVFREMKHHHLNHQFWWPGWYSTFWGVQRDLYANSGFLYAWRLIMKIFEPRVPRNYSTNYLKKVGSSKQINKPKFECSSSCSSVRTKLYPVLPRSPNQNCRILKSGQDLGGSKLITVEDGSPFL